MFCILNKELITLNRKWMCYHFLFLKELFKNVAQFYFLIFHALPFELLYDVKRSPNIEKSHLQISRTPTSKKCVYILSNFIAFFLRLVQFSRAVLLAEGFFPGSLEFISFAKFCKQPTRLPPVSWDFKPVIMFIRYCF